MIKIILSCRGRNLGTNNYRKCKPEFSKLSLWVHILRLNNEFKEAFKSSIFLLIKYTILEQMSRKISQINFSFIQHLYVGDDLYITDYEQISSVFRGVRFQGEEEGGLELSAEGQMYCSHAWTTTFTCILYIHGSFTNYTKSVHDLFSTKSHRFF